MQLGPVGSAGIGIDLGTAWTRVGVVMDGAVGLVPTREGANAFASRLAFDPHGLPSVGAPAARQGLTEPYGTAAGIVQLLGRRFEDPAVQIHRARHPAPVDPDHDHRPRFDLSGQTLAPEMAAALLLLEARGMAEARGGEGVERAVLTVPAGLGPRGRRALGDAAALAGLECIGLIDGPTAAALPYVLEHPEAGTVAVLDLGAGGFGFGIYRVQGGSVRILARDGIGGGAGDALDHALLERLLAGLGDEARSRMGLGTPARQRLLEVARRAKQELGRQSSVNLRERALVGSSRGPVHLECTLERVELEALLVPRLSALLAPLETAMVAANLQAEQVDLLLLTGGQIQDPLIVEALKAQFPRAECPPPLPEGFGACGAAIEAILLRDGPSPRSELPPPRCAEDRAADSLRTMARAVRAWWADMAGRPPGLASFDPVSRELVDDLARLMRSDLRRDHAPVRRES